MNTTMNRYRRERLQGETEDMHGLDLVDSGEKKEKERENPPKPMVLFTHYFSCNQNRYVFCVQ